VDLDRWQQLNELFLAAIEQDPARRAAFLDEACAGNPALRAEVESLVVSHEQAGSFMEAPAYEAEAERPDAGDALVGRRLGQYVVIRMLGQGGMGVVYLAEDTRLGRQVAIKALAPEFSQHDKRRERLRLEARAAAALSHPGIATVYALEEFDEKLYLIGEYVRGETLRDELARGPLAPEPLLDTGLQIARALAAAHDRGVIHRDLKPENVIRTPAGAIKILDFGLARFQSRAPVDPGAARLTEEGAVLGTPAYISPEQLRGWEVDCRADIFSLGVLLYEMGCGVHPFAGSDSASTIARILEHEPVDAAELTPSISRELARAICRCLQKDREQRYPTAGELIEDLERPGGTLAQTASQSPRPTAASQSADEVAGFRLTPRWWWEFHQLSVGLLYYAMLYPTWKAKEWIPRPWGSLLFFAALAAVAVAANLRLHLWFTSRFYPAELGAQRGRVFRWIRRSDAVLALLFVVTAAAVADSHAAVATLFIAVAIGAFLGFAIIEPATTRAAFRRTRGAKTPRIDAPTKTRNPK
jgi:serine/threonine protein kinase